MKLISIIIPAYNEAECIVELHQRLVQVATAEVGYRFEFLFVDDGSSDRTLEVMHGLADKDDRVLFISLSRNFGHQVALTAGLDHANGDAVVFIDADLQHPPEVIPQLLRRWEHGDQVVNTVRNDDPNLSLLKRATSKTFYRIMNRLANTKIQANGADFRLLDKRAADGLRQVHERSRFIRGLVHWIGYRQSTVSYEADRRFAGASKYSLAKMLRLGFDGLFSFSTAPLQLATWMGLLFSFCAFVYATYALYQKLVVGATVPGWTSLLCVVLFMGGVQMITLGIHGSYIARIFEETRQRPVYLIKESVLGNLRQGIDANHEQLTVGVAPNVST